LTVLAKWQENWYLAGRSGTWSESKLFSMKVGMKMPGSHGFSPSNNYLHRVFESTNGITFYPEVRYRGIRVYPQWWHPSSAEPLVQCWMQGIGDAVDPGRDRIEQSLDAQRRGDFALWASICEELKQKSQAMRAQLVSEGWKDKHIDGLEKYCHVDDLEKIEGPPPVGEF